MRIVIIHFLNGNALVKQYFTNVDDIGISVISFIELLSYRDITYDEINEIKELVQEISVFDVSADDKLIIDFIIETRRKYPTLKLPDSIILATAKSTNAELISFDNTFEKVKSEYNKITILE